MDIQVSIILKWKDKGRKKTMAHKKGQGSTSNGRDSNPKYLGVKKYSGEITMGFIIDFKLVEEQGQQQVKILEFGRLNKSMVNSHVIHNYMLV